MTTPSSPIQSAAGEIAWRTWRDRRGRLARGVGGGCVLTLVCVAAAAVLVFTTRPLRGPKGLKADFTPAWSPDGRHIAFVSNRDGNNDIFVMEADGSHVRQLTQDPFAQLRYFNYLPGDYQPAWSPDGSQILFATSRDNPYWSWEAVRLYVMDADGTNQEALAARWMAFPKRAWDDVAGDAVWSPDGRGIAFVCPTSKYGTGLPKGYGICRASDNSSSTQPVDMPAGTDFWPDWSPDSRQLAFASDRDGTPEIYVTNADSPGLTQLTYDLAADSFPHWSPDGSRIAFTSERDGNKEIYVMKAGGSNWVRLTDDPADDWDSDWSPDGQRLVFVSDRGGDDDIYVMNADGSNVTLLTHD